MTVQKPLVFCATFVASLTLLFAPTPTPAQATTTLVPACGAVNIRTGSSTTAPIKVSLGANASLTIVGQVSGGTWNAVCPSSKTGNTWYRVSAINGKSVSSLYGVASLYAATGVLTTAR